MSDLFHITATLAGIVCFMFVSGCAKQNMKDQSRLKPLETSSLFEDGRSARPLVAGTISREHLRTDEPLYTGKSGGVLAKEFPFPITRNDLNHGREQFNIYCSPCHGRLGDGAGMVAQRGFRRPPTLHQDRLRDAPVGHFFDVITNGFGVMYDYSDRIPPRERWEIIAYIRALQLSQNATLADVPAEQRQKLKSGGR